MTVELRKPYDASILQEILIQNEFRTIDDAGKAYPPGHEVYIAIASEMKDRGSQITPRHVHTIVNNDRKGLKSLLLKIYNIRLFTVAEMDDTSITNQTVDSTKSSHSKQIKLILFPENWSQMKVRKLVSGGRLYWKFKEGWADVIADKIAQQHKSVECVFSFKNNLVNPTANAQCYAKFVGNCVQCNASIRGELLREPPKDADVIITCQISNIVDNLHVGNKKRPLRGVNRQKVARKLIDENKDAVTYRREEAKRLKRFRQKEPATIPTCAVLRKAKEQELLKACGLAFSNPVLNLLQQSKFGKYAGSIRTVNALPFSCIYWTQEQFLIYVARCKKNQNAVLAIDATGGIAKRAAISDPHVFLYQCVLITAEGSVPVFQMISADQSALHIGNFLRYIISQRAPIPPTVVSDFGWALLIATSQIFGKCTDLPDYLQKCYNVIETGGSSLPASYIRLDVSHLIAMVARWKCLKQSGHGRAVRRFYLRCVSQSYQMTDFDSLTYFLESVLIVSLSEYVGCTSDGRTLAAESRLQYINNVIKGTVVDDREAVDNTESEEEDVEEAENQDKITVTGWKTWAQRLCDTARCMGAEASEGSAINACFNPKFAEKLSRQLLPYLPLWTGVMRSYFKRGSVIATSSSVEAEFNDLKNRALAGQLPMRVDKFVLRHLEHLDGRIKLASKPRDQPSENDKASDTHESSSAWNVQDVNRETLVNKGVRSESHTETHFASKNEVSSKLNEFSFQHVHHSTPKSFLEGNTESRQESHISQDLSDLNTYLLEDLGVCENWRGLGDKSQVRFEPAEDKSQPKKRVKPTYLDNCPEWDYIKEAKLGTLPVFRNGFQSGSVKINTESINLTRTCAFDSLIQIIIHTMAVNRAYYILVETCTSPIITLARTMLNDKNLKSGHLVARAKILMDLNLFANAITLYTRKIRKLDAECNVAHLADELLYGDPSYIKRTSCNCGYTNTRHFVAVNTNVDILMCQGLHKMQEAIEDAQVYGGACYQCKKKSVTENRTYGPHILVDLSVTTDETYVVKNKKARHALDSIANLIKLDESEYMLAGVIEYIKEHYIAYAKTGLYWSKYDDIHGKRVNANPRTEIHPHLIMYAIVKK